MCIQLSSIDTVYRLLFSICRYISRAKWALCVTLKSRERGPGDEALGTRQVALQSVWEVTLLEILFTFDLVWVPACPEMHGHGASFCPYTIIFMSRNAQTRSQLLSVYYNFTLFHACFLNVLLSMGIKVHRALATKQGLKSTMHRFSHEQ